MDGVLARTSTKICLIGRETGFIGAVWWLASSWPVEGAKRLFFDIQTDGWRRFCRGGRLVEDGTWNSASFQTCSEISIFGTLWMAEQTVVLTPNWFDSASWDNDSLEPLLGVYFHPVCEDDNLSQQLRCFIKHCRILHPLKDANCSNQRTVWEMLGKQAIGGWAVMWRINCSCAADENHLEEVMMCNWTPEDSDHKSRWNTLKCIHMVTSSKDSRSSNSHRW